MNGLDKETEGRPQKWHCARCNHGFREEYKKSTQYRKFQRNYQLIHEHAKAFVYGKCDLDIAAAWARKKKSTFRNWMNDYFETFLIPFDEAKRLDLGRVCQAMGIDLTYYKEEGEERPYLKVINNLTSDLLYNVRLVDQTKDTIIKHLERVRDELHCNPKLITCDLGGNILESIKTVFPNALIQACWIHLHWLLEDNLPTINVLTGVGPRTRELWRSVKVLIMKAAVAVDEPQRALLIEKLRQIDLTYDKKKPKLEGKKDTVGAAEGTIMNFIKNCEEGYYRAQRTLRALLNINDLSRVVYNNVVERSFRDSKKKSKQVRLWCSLYDNAYHHFKLLDRLGRAGEQNRAEAKEKSARKHLPLSFFLSYLPFVRFSEFSDVGFDTDEVAAEAEAIGTSVTTVLGDMAIGAKYLKKIERYVAVKKGVVSPKDIEERWQLPKDVAWNVVQILGFQISLEQAIKDVLDADSVVSAPLAVQPGNLSTVNTEDITVGTQPFMIPADIGEVRQKNAYAIAAVLYWSGDKYITTGQIAEKLKGWNPKITMSNVSREITSSGKILNQYYERETIEGRNGKGIRLTQEGHRLFEERKLVHA